MNDQYLTEAGKDWIHITLCKHLPEDTVSHPHKLHFAKFAITRAMLHDYRQGRLPALEIKQGTGLPLFIPVPWEYFTEGEP